MNKFRTLLQKILFGLNLLVIYPYIRKTGKRPKKSQNQQHFFIQNLPGIGPTLAHKLLAHFNTIENIIRADARTLTEVEGIGKAKAEKLFHFFRA